MAANESWVLKVPAAKSEDAQKHFEGRLELEATAFEVHEDMKNGVERFVLLDVRKQDAFAAEHIKGATNFCHLEIEKESVKKLSRELVYVTYCSGVGCNASAKGAAKLAKLGFKVKELLGGLQWWKGEGYPTEKGAKG